MKTPEPPKGYFFRVIPGSLKISYYVSEVNCHIELRRNYIFWSTKERAIQIPDTHSRNPTEVELENAMEQLLERWQAANALYRDYHSKGTK